MIKQESKISILLVEDQISLATNVAEYFEEKGHTIDFANNGVMGLTLALENFYDVIILDLNLPKLDGLSVCEQIRSQSNRHTPVLMLTARDSIDDKVAGFGVGTDDYLTKPFSLQELEVRCMALARRHLLQKTDIVTIGGLSIDRKQNKVTRENMPIELHTMGFKILTILAEAYPQVVSKTELTQKLWGDEPTESDALRSHIYQLRNSLDKPFGSSMLKTVHGVGFVLELNDD